MGVESRIGFPRLCATTYATHREDGARGKEQQQDERPGHWRQERDRKNRYSTREQRQCVGGRRRHHFSLQAIRRAMAAGRAPTPTARDDARPAIVRSSNRGRRPWNGRRGFSAWTASRGRRQASRQSTAWVLVSGRFAPTLPQHSDGSHGDCLCRCGQQRRRMNVWMDVGRGGETVRSDDWVREVGAKARRVKSSRALMWGPALAGRG